MLCTTAVYPLYLRWLLLLFDFGTPCIKKIKFFPCIEFDGLSAPFPDILIECCRLFQKGDPFWNHHGVGNSMPSCSFNLTPLSKSTNEASMGFCGVIEPHHFEYIFFEVNLVNQPVPPEEMLQHI